MKLTILLFVFLSFLSLSRSQNHNITISDVNTTIHHPADNECHQFDDKSIFVKSCNSSALIFIVPTRKVYHINFTDHFSIDQTSGTCYSDDSTSIFAIVLKRNNTFHFFVVLNGTLQDFTFKVKELEEDRNIQYQYQYFRMFFIRAHLVVRVGINRYFSYPFEELYLACRHNKASNVSVVSFNSLQGVSEHMTLLTHISTNYILLWSSESIISLDAHNNAVIINRFEVNYNANKLIVSSQEYYSVDWSRIPAHCWENMGVLQDTYSSFILVQCFKVKRGLLINISPFMVLSYDSAADYLIVGFSHTFSHSDPKFGRFSTSLFFFYDQGSYHLRQYSSLERPLQFQISDTYRLNVPGYLISMMPKKNASENKLLLLYSHPNENNVIYLKEEIIPEGILCNEQTLKEASNSTICTQNDQLCFSHSSKDIENRFIYDVNQNNSKQNSTNLTMNLTVVNKYQLKDHMTCYHSLVDLHCQELRINPLSSKMDKKLCAQCLEGPDSCSDYNPVYFALLKKNCETFNMSFGTAVTQRECIPTTWKIGDEAPVHGARVVYENSTHSATNPDSCSYLLKLRNDQPSTLVVNFLHPNSNSSNYSLSFHFKKFFDNSSETFNYAINTTASSQQPLSVVDEFDVVEINFAGINYLEFEVLQFPQPLHQNVTEQVVCTLYQIQAGQERAGQDYRNNSAAIQYNHSSQLGVCPKHFDNHFCYLMHHSAQYNNPTYSEIVLDSSYVLPTCTVQISVNGSYSFILLSFNILKGESISLFTMTSDGLEKVNHYDPHMELYREEINRPDGLDSSTPWNITATYSSKNTFKQVLRKYHPFSGIMIIQYGTKASAYWMIVMVLMSIFVTSSIIVNIALFIARRLLRRNFIVPIALLRSNPYDIANKNNFHEMQVTLSGDERTKLEAEGYRVTETGNPVSLEHLDCVLCLEAVDMKEHQIFLCGRHYVHVECFSEWLEKSIQLGKNDLCPMRCNDILLKPETLSAPSNRATTEESQELLNNISIATGVSEGEEEASNRLTVS